MELSLSNRELGLSSPSLLGTGSFFFQLLVSVCSTVASLEETFQGKKYKTCTIYLHFIVCEDNFETSIAFVVPFHSCDQYKS